MAGSKRNRIRKALSPNARASSPPKDSIANDDELMDDLMAQLDSRDVNAQAQSAAVLKEVEVGPADTTSPPNDKKKDSKARHQARQARRAAELAEKYAPTDVDADAKLEAQAKEEEKAIKHVCDELDLEMHEITPDGHCLFSAVADQLAVLGVLSPAQATYAHCRQAAAEYMRSHPDDFIPFLPSILGEDAPGAESDTGLMTPAQLDKYCNTIRDTGVWGGEPEIVALASAFRVPIHVVQYGTPSIVMHEPHGSRTKSSTTDKNVARISYHRRMYGLGEHYNSLRPKKSFTESIKSLIS